MNTFKQDPENEHEKKCVCKTNMGLFIPNRRLSLITAAGILVAFTTFIIGYFVGQHAAVESFASKVEQESFADQIYASLFTPGEYRITKDEVSEPEIASVQPIEGEQEPTTQKALSDQVAQADAQEQLHELHELAEEDVSLLPQEHYYAQLIGFGTERAAQKFAHRLGAQNISVTVKKRRSKTAKGTMISWYQVVTQVYTDKEKLRELVDRIEKTEKIKGAQIVSC